MNIYPESIILICVIKSSTVNTFSVLYTNINSLFIIVIVSYLTTSINNYYFIICIIDYHGKIFDIFICVNVFERAI